MYAPLPPPLAVRRRQAMETPSPNCVVATDALLQLTMVEFTPWESVGYLLAYLAIMHIFTYAALYSRCRRMAQAAH